MKVTLRLFVLELHGDPRRFILGVGFLSVGPRLSDELGRTEEP